jgi:HSP20 family protein
MRRTYFDPVQDLADLQEQVNRAFADLLGWTPPTPEAGRSEVSAPPLDVAETDASFILRLDLPGVRRADLEVSVENNVVTIKARRQPPVVPEGATAHRTESPGGDLYRSFPLPSTANPATIAARLERGVLRVTIDKLPEAQPRKIEVTTA